MFCFLLYTIMNQLCGYMHPLSGDLPPISAVPALQVITERRAGPPRQTAASHRLSALPVLVYVVQCPTLSCLICLHKSFLYVCTSVPALQTGSSIFIFLAFRYMCSYAIFVFLTYFTLYHFHWLNFVPFYGEFILYLCVCIYACVCIYMYIYVCINPYVLCASYIAMLKKRFCSLLNASWT